MVLAPEPSKRGDPGQYHKLKEMGDCYLALNNLPQARQCYRSAIDLAPNRPEAYVALGNLAVQAEDFASAMEAFHKARLAEPACAEAYAGLALICQQRGDDSGAFDWYLKCLEQDADNLAALLGLFQASCRMGTFARIIGFLEIYLQRHSDDIAVLFCLSTLYARDGRLNQARSAIRKVLEIEPGKSEAQQLLYQIERNMLQGAVGGR